MEIPQYKNRARARLGVAAILVLVVVFLAAAAMFSVIHRANLSGERAERHYQQRELSDKVKTWRQNSITFYFVHGKMYSVGEKGCNYRKKLKDNRK